MMSPRKISKEENYRYQYSICTLVNKLPEYHEMVESFKKAGFSEEDCEFLYADNTERNEFEAYAGINSFLNEALGKYVIICHQDILITKDNRVKLENQLNLVSGIDANWGVLGNAGVNNMYNMSYVITRSDLHTYQEGLLPSKVQSLDENFLLLKASANLAVSGNLAGFHMYGTDICLIAECLGYSAYAIDFNMIHKGTGLVDESFYRLSDSIQEKYTHFFRGRYIRSTITRFYLSSNPLLNSIMNVGFIKSMARLYNKFKFSLRAKL